jgi:PTH1 family peptidyl-tRNA hydrolase
MNIFGLGNPGFKYRSTRHNAGYMFCDTMAKMCHTRYRVRRGYKVAAVKINGRSVNLIKPICWMNQSGIAIAGILQNLDRDFIIVLDDFNLPLGIIRLRRKGSDGGHLGLRSIITTLGRSDFPRLRIGIGCPDNDVMTYVLTPFKRHEKSLLNTVIKEGVRGIEIMLRQGFVKAQNYINAIDLTIKSEARNSKQILNDKNSNS